MSRLIYSSKEHTRLGIKVFNLSNEKKICKVELGGHFDKLGYYPSKEFTKMKIDKVKHEQTVKERRQLHFKPPEKNKTKKNISMLFDSIFKEKIGNN